MERPRDDGPEEPKTKATPTARDAENAQMREEVARRMEAEYVECLSLAFKFFGPGWEPSCRHFLVEKEEEERSRRTGERARPAATVYTVRKGDQTRHFTVEGEEVIVWEDYILAEGEPACTISHFGRKGRTEGTLQ